LTQEGGTIQLFSNGKNLLEDLKKDPPFDIIVADLLMSEVSRLQILEKSKKCNPSG